MVNTPNILLIMASALPAALAELLVKNFIHIEWKKKPWPIVRFVMACIFWLGFYILLRYLTTHVFHFRVI